MFRWGLSGNHVPNEHARTGAIAERSTALQIDNLELSDLLLMAVVPTEAKWARSDMSAGW
jgi:hypothetical protein